MYWYLTAVSILFLLAAGASIIFALFAWKRRPHPGSVAFSVFMLAITLWILAYLLQIVSTDLPAKLVWAKIQYLGVGVAPTAWLVFMLRYTNRQKWLTVKQWTWLLLVPLITFLLALTNASHQLIWVRAHISTQSLLPLLVTVPGIWYWFIVVYLYGALLAGSLWLLTSTRYEISSLVPHQTIILLTGLTMPWFGGILYLSGMSFINLTALTFAFCGIIVGKYALGFRFVKQTPLAKQSALNNLTDGVLVVDPDLMIVDANPAMGQIAAQIAERPFSALLGSHLKEIFPEIVGEYETLKQRTVDIPYKKHEQTFTYEIKRTPIQDWRHIVSSEMLVFHDISDRKQQEDLRNEITHSMVHDLRSPISNSLFALQMLKQETFAENHQGQHLVDLTYENTEKVLQLVNNILDVNRLENSNIPIRQTAVSLPKLIDRVLKSLSPRAIAKNITLTRRLQADLPPAWADEALLERVLQNLLDNSLKFSPVGSTVQITAVLVNQHDPIQRRLHVSVSDEGPGLSPDIADTLFNKFTTGPSRESGNGLGLAFCQMALAAHQQKIWVTQPGETGITFTFSLALPPQLPDDIQTEDYSYNNTDQLKKNNIMMTPVSSNW